MDLALNNQQRLICHRMQTNRFPWLSCHSSLSSIASSRSSRLYPVSIQSCCRYLLVGWPTLARPCEGIHRRTSLMSLSLFLQQCPACLVCLIWMVFVMGVGWPFSCCFGGCCFQDLFNKAFSILMQFPSCFFSIHLVDVHVVHPYSRIVMTAAWKKLHFILLDRSDLHMINNHLIAVHTFTRCLLIYHFL